MTDTSIDGARVREILDGLPLRIREVQHLYGIPDLTKSIIDDLSDALSAIASRQAVVPLKWDETSWQNNTAIRWTGHGAVNALIRRDLGDTWFSYDGRHFATLDEAKAAAQADYTQRIRSALE